MLLFYPYCQYGIYPIDTVTIDDSVNLGLPPTEVRRHIRGSFFDLCGLDAVRCENLELFLHGEQDLRRGHKPR
jgi:hypothetical protein